MKSFDLTFSGMVLPEHDPGQVKQDLAKFLSIEDSAKLEEIFSGRTIVLRQNLDRKTAAEYFSRIAEIGGQAALVESLETRNNDADSSTTTGRKPDKAARIARDRGSKQPVIHDTVTPVEFSTDQAVQELDTRLRQSISEGNQELSRLRRLVSELKEKSRQRYLTLQSRKDAFHRIAEQELAINAQTIKVTLANVHSEIAVLQSQLENLTQTATEETKELDKLQLSRKTHAENESARIESLKVKAKDAEQALIAEIEEKRESKRITAAAEIKRLQQLILDIQHQAEIDDATFEREVENAKSKLAEDVSTLEQQKIDALRAVTLEIDNSVQQQNEVRRRLEAETAELQQKQVNIQRQCQEESDRLQTEQTQIRTRRDDGIAEVERASTQLEEKTRDALKKLYAMELQAKRRQSEVLEDCQKLGLMQEVLAEITAH